MQNFVNQRGIVWAVTLFGTLAHSVPFCDRNLGAYCARLVSFPPRICPDPF